MTMYERLQKATKKETLDFLTDFFLNIAEVLIGLPRKQVRKTLRTLLTEEQWSQEKIEVFFDPTLEDSVVYTLVTEQAKGRSKDAWMKYPEEKPEEDGTYLVYTPDDVVTTIQVADYLSDLEEWEYVDSPTYFDLGDVTHWQPLPEPPKEEWPWQKN